MACFTLISPSRSHRKTAFHLDEKSHHVLLSRDLVTLLLHTKGFKGLTVRNGELQHQSGRVLLLYSLKDFITPNTHCGRETHIIYTQNTNIQKRNQWSSSSICSCELVFEGSILRTLANVLATFSQRVEQTLLQ